MSQPDFILDYLQRIAEITEGYSDDMHEPDDLTVEWYQGFGLDNAFMQPPGVCKETQISKTKKASTDAGFWLIRDKGLPTERKEWFNLACVLAVLRTGPWRH
jgi:hypothetical protein